MNILGTGVYTISNVRSANLGSIANADDRTPLVSSSGADSKYSHKWLVTRCYNGRYTIMNQQHLLFARCESRPNEASEVYASCDNYYWDLEQTRNLQFRICPVDSDLFWMSPDNEHGTPITLGKAATNSRCHWIFSPQPAAIETMLPIREILPPMKGAFTMLHSIYFYSGQVEIYSHQCNDLIRRARALFDVLNQETEAHDGEDGQRLTVDQVIGNLKYIRDFLRSISSLSILLALLRSNEIAERIEEAYERLSDITPLEVDSPPFIKGLQTARRVDTQHLKTLLAKISEGDEATIKLFQLPSHELKDALIAIYHFVDSHTDDSVEKEILKFAASVFKQKSKQSIPSCLPSWTISSFEVEIDHNVELGIGGFGRVAKGIWNGLVVAVKQMTLETSRRALMTEINIWKGLRHDNVLPFYGASVTASPPFIVSKYMTNGNVVQYLQRNLAANRLELLHGVTLGMIYLHSREVTHGDLKGVNILIDEIGRACIADFGLSYIQAEALSRTVRTAVRDTVNAGTLRFMAPERMKGKLIKPSDVYSFAMLMFELFTGTAPFHTIPDQALFNMIAEQLIRLEQPRDPEVLMRGLSEESWQLIWSCSVSEPGARPTFNGIEPKLRLLATNWHPPSGSQVPSRSTGRDDFDINIEDLGDDTTTNDDNAHHQPSTSNPQHLRRQIRCVPGNDNTNENAGIGLPSISCLNQSLHGAFSHQRTKITALNSELDNQKRRYDYLIRNYKSPAGLAPTIAIADQVRHSTQNSFIPSLYPSHVSSYIPSFPPEQATQYRTQNDRFPRFPEERLSPRSVGSGSRDRVLRVQPLAPFSLY